MDRETMSSVSTVVIPISIAVCGGNPLKDEPTLKTGSLLILGNHCSKAFDRPIRAGQARVNFTDSDQHKIQFLFNSKERPNSFGCRFS
jgi:hypothetical protein